MEWQKLEETLVYKGWRNMLKKRFRLPNGQEADFDIIGNDAFVTVAALTVDEEFVLIKQFRPGPEAFLHSFPEGFIEPHESPEEAARRELLEETGYEAGEIVLLREMRSAYSTEQQTCLLATGCKKVGSQSLDHTEFIEVMTMPLDQLRSFLTNPNGPFFSNVDCAYLALDRLGRL